jgi:hypothetical protein
MFRQKAKLFTMLQATSVQILVNFGQKKSHQIELQSLGGFGILEKELVAGPLASSPRRPIAACPGRRARGNAAWRGHHPPPHAGAAGRPPRLIHAPCMRSPAQEPYRALLQSKWEANSIASTPRASAILFFPCHRLPSSTVTTSSASAPYAPPPASSLTSRAPSCPRVPHRPLLPHRRAPLRPLTGAPLPTEFTAAVSPPR